MPALPWLPAKIRYHPALGTRIGRKNKVARFLVGVDIGGTFTDCVVLDRSGRITATKASSTPRDFAEGMLAAMRVAAERLELSFEEFCREVEVLTHGTTVGTNALIQRKGAKVGLITTRGHEDAIHIMRGSRGVSSRDIAKVVHFPSSQKPVPIVPKRLIEGVSERVDCFGEMVVPLNEFEAEAAIRRLVAQGVEAIGVCFLWSFKNPAHERRLKEMIREIAPKVFVSCSVDIAPKWGEYERTTATALNAYIGPVMAKYLGNLDRQLKASGYAQPLQITQCGGGSISVDHAMESPLLTLDSGPVSGVTGSLYLGKLMGVPNIITTDMGGSQPSKRSRNAATGIGRSPGRVTASPPVVPIAHTGILDAWARASTSLACAAGTYNVLDRKVDLHGILHTNGKLSDTTSGFKALVLKAVGPFLKQKSVTVVPYTLVWINPLCSDKRLFRDQASHSPWQPALSP